MTLNQIIYFATTAERMHMASAAKELMIAQPSLSMSLHKLEDELGVPLFEKQGRGIVLTPEGNCFLPHAKRIIEDVNAAKLEMQRVKDHADSSLTLAYINPLSDFFLPRLFREFRNAYPNQQFTLKSVEMDTMDIVAALQNNTIDFALSSKVSGHEELTQIPILRQPLCLIVARGHPLEQEYERTGTPLRCKLLADYPLIIYWTRSPMHKRINEYFRSQGVTPQISHNVYNEMAIANLVAENIGIAIIAKVEHLPWDRITEIPLEGLSQSRNIYLTYRTDRKLFHAASQMVGFIRQQYGLE
jgi:DNA-binding transcriptional LysR family regulator